MIVSNLSKDKNCTQIRPPQQLPPTRSRSHVFNTKTGTWRWKTSFVSNRELNVFAYTNAPAVFEIIIIVIALSTRADCPSVFTRGSCRLRSSRLVNDGSSWYCCYYYRTVGVCTKRTKSNAKIIIDTCTYLSIPILKTVCESFSWNTMLCEIIRPVYLKSINRGH